MPSRSFSPHCDWTINRDAGTVDAMSCWRRETSRSEVSQMAAVRNADICRDIIVCAFAQPCGDRLLAHFRAERMGDCPGAVLFLVCT